MENHQRPISILANSICECFLSISGCSHLSSCSELGAEGYMLESRKMYKGSRRLFAISHNLGKATLWAGSDYVEPVAYVNSKV